jgi:5-methyltetrahydrofolate--homocysteine methyltransferase
LQAISQRVLLGDGAMGTQLQAAGLEPGGCGEAWNTQHPDRVLAIQKAYVDAGSDCLITNTFGGCRIMLDRHKLGDQVREINIAAAKLARQAFGAKPGFVLGDIGPFGGLLEPLGDVPQDKVRDAFAEQADALVAGGVDAIIIETQVALEELALAIEAANKAGASCIIGSLAYDVTLARDEIRTMMGVEPEQAATFMRDAGVHILALNCGTGIDMHWAAQCVRRYKAVCDLPTMAQPNGGQPELRAGKIVYKQTPEQMAAEAPELLAAGANIIGACCGSTPAHIAKLRPLIDDRNRGGR